MRLRQTCGNSNELVRPPPAWRTDDAVVAASRFLDRFDEVRKGSTIR
jgi:hypothetical protein